MMIRKPLDFPPAVARAFVKDMKSFFANISGVRMTYFLSSAERPGGGSPKNSEVSDRGATSWRCSSFITTMLGALAIVTCSVGAALGYRLIGTN
jgi:hypothetical protein